MKTNRLFLPHRIPLMSSTSSKFHLNQLKQPHSVQTCRVLFLNEWFFQNEWHFPLSFTEDLSISFPLIVFLAFLLLSQFSSKQTNQNRELWNRRQPEEHLNGAVFFFSFEQRKYQHAQQPRKQSVKVLSAPSQVPPKQQKEKQGNGCQFRSGFG